MICSAARMRKRLLAAAPAAVLGGLCWHAGGAAAALFLWLWISALLPDGDRYSYPRKRTVRLHRLFFCFALTAFLFSFAAWIIRRFPGSGPPSVLSDLLTGMGAVGFSLPIGKRALSLPLSARCAWGLGALLCALFLFLLISQTLWI